MITKASPFQIVAERKAGDQMKRGAFLMAESHNGGGCRLLISIGSGGVTWTLDRDDALAVAEFIRANAEEAQR